MQIIFEPSATLCRTSKKPTKPKTEIKQKVEKDTNQQMAF